MCQTTSQKKKLTRTVFIPYFKKNIHIILVLLDKMVTPLKIYIFLFEVIVK